MPISTRSKAAIRFRKITICFVLFPFPFMRNARRPQADRKAREITPYGREEYRLVDIYQSWMRPTAKGSAPKISKAAVIVHPPIVYFYTFIIHCHGMPCNRNRCSAHTCMRLLRKWRYTPMKKKNSPDDHI